MIIRDFLYPEQPCSRTIYTGTLNSVTIKERKEEGKKESLVGAGLNPVLESSCLYQWASPNMGFVWFVLFFMRKFSDKSDIALGFVVKRLEMKPEHYFVILPLI